MHYSLHVTVQNFLQNFLSFVLDHVNFCLIMSFSHVDAIRIKVAYSIRGNSGKIQEGCCLQSSILTDFRLVMSTLVIFR